MTNPFAPSAGAIGSAIPQSMTQPQPAAFGGPAPAAFGGPLQPAAYSRQPLDPRTAMHGLSNADVETRFPEVARGYSYQLKLICPRLRQKFHGGMSWFFECEVLQTNDPGCTIGTTRVVKLGGFGNPKAQRYAESDLKQILALLLAPEFASKGITVNWKPSREEEAQGLTWENFCAYILGAENPAAARTFGTTTSEQKTESQRTVTKYVFFAA